MKNTKAQGWYSKWGFITNNPRQRGKAAENISKGYCYCSKKGCKAEVEQMMVQPSAILEFGA